MIQTPRDRAIGLTLLAVGLLACASSLLGKGTVWVWLLAASGLSLSAHRSSKNALWVVPGGLLGGLALSFLFTFPVVPSLATRIGRWLRADGGAGTSSARLGVVARRDLCAHLGVRGALDEHSTDDFADRWLRRVLLVAVQTRMNPDQNESRPE
jgi:hypothetical protein